MQDNTVLGEMILFISLLLGILYIISLLFKLIDNVKELNKGYKDLTERLKRWTK